MIVMMEPVSILASGAIYTMCAFIYIMRGGNNDNYGVHVLPT